MYKTDSCPCCLSTRFTFDWAVISPFLASYAVKEQPFICKLLECAECSLRFFDVRLSPQEVERLYSGYRGDEYFVERHRHEFWYSRAVNDGIGGDPEEIEKRVTILENFIAPHVKGADIDNVLDYGGDKGQFIPASLGKSKYVFELSDAAPVAGVSRIASEQELHKRKFDLVMLLGVLEHCSDPANVLERIRSLLAPGGFLCVGVPHERYSLQFISDSSLYRGYLDALLRFPRLVQLADFYSTAGRVRLGAVPPLGFVKCHEHLNFFNEEAMRALLRRSGFEVLGAAVETFVKYPAKSESLSVLSRVATTHQDLQRLGASA